MRSLRPCAEAKLRWLGVVGASNRVASGLLDLAFGAMHLWRLWHALSLAVRRPRVVRFPPMEYRFRFVEHRLRRRAMGGAGFEGARAT
jgi:hypothetical protein